MKSVDEAFQIAAKIRAFSPLTVWYVGQKLVEAYSNYGISTLRQKEKSEKEAEILRNRQAQFTQVAQHDLGLLETDDERLQSVYKEVLKDIEAESNG